MEIKWTEAWGSYLIFLAGICRIQADKIHMEREEYEL